MTTRGRLARFPQGFLWGAATAAHQVEGGNHWNDWWEYEQAGRLPYASGDCCKHFELFDQDFDLARSLGHNCHRFSIEWSRVEPRAGQWNDAALRHYGEVIRSLQQHGLEPVVTLHHFTNPAWFTRNGGWQQSDAARQFSRFVERSIEHLPGVRYWITINEPTVLAVQGYINGEWPPLYRRSWWKAVRVLRNLAAAHLAARAAIKKANPGALVGFAHNAQITLPCNPRKVRDRFAAHLWDQWRNRLFFRLLGCRLGEAAANARRLDFIGINYYTRSFVTTDTFGPSALLGRTCKRAHHPEQGPYSMVGWEVFPRGLGSVLDRFSEYGLPLFVTENGIATEDDDLRRVFLEQHLQVLGESIESGAPILGYMHWSLIDNYEWSLGTRPRFGLAAVDYATQQRTPRESARVLQRYATAGRSGGYSDDH
ncbi:MAG: glycoside hydrolase family 1 protein [Gammaproteobacteria bacterium]